jgi:hypothetical protein
MSIQSMSENPLVEDSPDSVLEQIGLQARESGDFQFARRVLQAAIKRLDDAHDNASRWIELVINVSDTYLSEGNTSPAKIWYMKALERSEQVTGKHTVQVAFLLGRLAQVAALDADAPEFENCFEQLTRAYLLSTEEDLSLLLDSLMDLSWAWCVKGNVKEVQRVNELIGQIKQLEQELGHSRFSAA